MEDNGQGFACLHRPTMSERIWRELGFRYHLGEEPEDIDALEGWMKTDIRLSFGLVDRLRILLTGRILVSSTAHHDTPSASIVKNRIDWRIYAPGER